MIKSLRVFHNIKFIHAWQCWIPVSKNGRSVFLTIPLIENKYGIVPGIFRYCINSNTGVLFRYFFGIPEHRYRYRHRSCFGIRSVFRAIASSPPLYSCVQGRLVSLKPCLCETGVSQVRPETHIYTRRYPAPSTPSVRVASLS